MPQSAEIFNQLQGMTNMPDFKTQVTQAYETPVLRPLIDEAARTEADFLPTLFEPFTKMGTGASDISAASFFNNLGSSLGRQQKAAAVPRNLLNFYGGQIDNLANNMTTQWGQRQGSLSNLYNMAFQREQAAAQQAQQAAAQADAERRQREMNELIRFKLTGQGGVNGMSNQSQDWAKQNIAYTKDAAPNALQQILGGLGGGLFGGNATGFNNFGKVQGEIEELNNLFPAKPLTAFEGGRTDRPDVMGDWRRDLERMLGIRA